MKKLILFVLTIVFIWGANSALFAQTKFAAREGAPDFRIPFEVKPFVEAEMKAIAYAKADLNGDGTLDYILVLEQAISKDSEMNSRPALIIVRDRNGRLSLAARNRFVIACRGCIGGMSDPFESLTVRRGGFSVTNRGGFRDRWIGRYDFEFSPRDRTWQLARVAEANYESVKAKPVWRKTYTPKDFGKISFDDFDPDDLSGTGALTGAPAAAAGATQNKTRAVSIYLLEFPKNDQTAEPTIVRVERRVDARAPLAGAIKALLAAMIENNKPIDSNKYLYKIEFVSARIKNKTARLDFKYKQDTQFGWLSEAHASFPEIVRKTATQFPNAERVLMCINGYDLRADDERFVAISCDEIWRNQ